MPADAALLSAVPLFERFNDEERTWLANQLDEVEFQPGQLVFRRSDPGGAVFIVATGEVEVFIEDTTGERIVFEKVCDGHFFGELSLLDGESRSASAQAMTRTRANAVSPPDGVKLVLVAPVSPRRRPGPGVPERDKSAHLPG